jgi:hypothetical protein
MGEGRCKTIGFQTFSQFTPALPYAEIGAGERIPDLIVDLPPLIRSNPTSCSVFPSTFSQPVSLLPSPISPLSSPVSLLPSPFSPLPTQLAGDSCPDSGN